VLCVGQFVVGFGGVSFCVVCGTVWCEFGGVSVCVVCGTVWCGFGGVWFCAACGTVWCYFGEWACAAGGFMVGGCVILCLGIVWLFQTTRKLHLSPLSQSRY
jgi:hypothetical protein